jgi:hypothetical protein
MDLEQVLQVLRDLLDLWEFQLDIKVPRDFKE